MNVMVARYDGFKLHVFLEKKKRCIQIAVVEFIWKDRMKQELQHIIKRQISAYMERSSREGHTCGAPVQKFIDKILKKSISLPELKNAQNTL